MPNISLTPLPFSTDIIRPGCGPEQWHNKTERIPYPTELQPVSIENSLEVYYRFPWSQLETGSGVYNWDFFDGLIRTAMNNNQKLSFGIYSHRPETGATGRVSFGTNVGYYPVHLHNKMQAEANKDFLQNGVWMPNYNSPAYLSALFGLNKAVRDHLVNTKIAPAAGPNAGKSITAGDAVYCIDVRGFGSWGEWHFGSTGLTWDTWPAGRQPTAASLKAIIDAHTKTFDLWPLVMMIAAYDGGYTGINVFARIPEVAHYALTARNAWGAVGFRRDQWGATDGYLHNLMAGNNLTYNGSVPFKTMILEKYKYAPVTGEPMPNAGIDMTDLLNQVNLYHATSIGNGNYGGYPADINKRERIRTAFKNLGYKLRIESGTFTNTNTSVSVTLNWRNGGIGPAYEDWNVEYILSGIKHTSLFKPKLFQPSTVATPVDTFTFALPAGSYTLAVRVTDPKGYRQPMPVYNATRQADGSYLLGTVVVSAVSQPNQGPVVSAGADQIITLPINSTVVTGSASDPDGIISAVKWEIVSGSGVIASAGTAATMIAGLTEGTTRLKFTATDNKGAIASDEMIITVKPAIVKPEKKILKITVPEFVVGFNDGSSEIIKGT